MSNEKLTLEDIANAAKKLGMTTDYPNLGPLKSFKAKYLELVRGEALLDHDERRLMAPFLLEEYALMKQTVGELSTDDLKLTKLPEFLDQRINFYEGLTKELTELLSS